MATLTRQELHDLVWAEPRTAIAARLGVSDVAIGKACIRENVPAPPRGYWARNRSGQDAERPGLPIRLPAQPHAVYVGDGDERHRHNGRLIAPVFTEDVEAQVAAALGKIGPTSWRRTLADPHKALRKVLAGEERRKLEVAKTGWTIFGPYFGSAEHQRQLTIFNRLAHALDAVWRYAEVRVHEEFEQGKGTSRHLVLYLGYSSNDVVLAFVDHIHGRQENRRSPAGPACALFLTADSGGRHDADWTDIPGNKLESQLPGIVATILRNAEHSQRWWLERRHQEAVEAAAEAERKRIVAEAERHRLHLERLAAAEHARREALAVEAARWHQAAQIRAYIAHLDASGRTDAEWRAWALKVADEMDPTSGRLQR